MTGTPLLTVVIASRNRRDLLQRCLGSLAQQTLPSEQFEVVVCDDGSVDGSAEMLSQPSWPFELRVLKPGQVGRAAARNLAVADAQAPICLIIDDDVIASRQLVAEHLRAHQEHERLLGIGQLTQETPRRRDWYARRFARAWNRHYENLGESEADWTDCYGGNLSAPTAELREVGGFTVPALALGQDLELAFRLWRHGCRPRFLPGASGVHDDQKPGGRLLAEALGQGRVHVALADHEPAMLPKLLGWFTDTTRREIVLRRTLLTLRVPPKLLVSLGPLLPGRQRQQLWFDFVRRLAFWLGVRSSVDRARWLSLTHGVPVLMYHAFGPPGQGSRYAVGSRAFSLQLTLLRLLRYRVITFVELARTLRAGELPPPRAAVITIDDGYEDNLTVALPILRRHRLPATIFLVSRRLGAGADWSEQDALRDRPLMSAEQVTGIRDRCISWGAHTRTHPFLPDSDDELIREEVAGSRSDLREQLGGEIEVFAYPFGGHHQRAVAAVAGAGYIGACTTHPRLARP